MKERIKAIRKALGLSGERFGEKIGLKRVAISQLETGRTTPTNQTIMSICREFNVSEEWLRNGIGDMFVSVPPDKAIDSFVSKVKKDNGFKKCFLSTLSKMDESEWDFVEKFMKNVLEETGAI